MYNSFDCNPPHGRPSMRLCAQKDAEFFPLRFTYSMKRGVARFYSILLYNRL